MNYEKEFEDYWNQSNNKEAGFVKAWIYEAWLNGRQNKQYPSECTSFEMRWAVMFKNGRQLKFLQYRALQNNEWTEWTSVNEVFIDNEEQK